MISAKPDSPVLYRCGHVILLCVLKFNKVQLLPKMEVGGWGEVSKLPWLLRASQCMQMLISKINRINGD